MLCLCVCLLIFRDNLCRVFQHPQCLAKVSVAYVYVIKWRLCSQFCLIFWANSAVQNLLHGFHAASELWLSMLSCVDLLQNFHKWSFPFLCIPYNTQRPFSFFLCRQLLPSRKKKKSMKTVSKDLRILPVRYPDEKARSWMRKKGVMCKQRDFHISGPRD